jgi:hypothetical protein
VQDGIFYIYVIFRPSNSAFFTESVFISNRQSLENVLENITYETLEDYIKKVRPSSAHRIIGIYSMGVKIMKMDRKIGARIEIPDYIAKNHNFVNPESSYNMCFSNCTAYHISKNKRCAKLGKELFEEFHKKKPSKDYLGIKYETEIAEYETFSNVGFLRFSSY